VIKTNSAWPVMITSMLLMGTAKNVDLIVLAVIKKAALNAIMGFIWKMGCVTIAHNSVRAAQLKTTVKLAMKGIS